MQIFGREAFHPTASFSQQAFPVLPWLFRVPASNSMRKMLVSSGRAGNVVPIVAEIALRLCRGSPEAPTEGSLPFLPWIHGFSGKSLTLNLKGNRKKYIKKIHHPISHEKNHGVMGGRGSFFGEGCLEGKGFQDDLPWISMMIWGGSHLTRDLSYIYIRTQICGAQKIHSESQNMRWAKCHQNPDVTFHELVG